MRNASWALVLSLGLVVVAPSVGWTACEEEPPLLTIAQAPVLNVGQPVYRWVVQARDKMQNCSNPKLTMTVTGLSGLGSNVMLKITPLPTGTLSDEVSAEVTVNPSSTTAGTHHITYTVTDSIGKSNSVTMPLVIGNFGRNNDTPSLDPVSDITVALGQRVSFVVGLSDPNNDLSANANDLMVDGLPTLNANTTYKVWKTLRTDRIACEITVAPTQAYERGTYLVNITGRDLPRAVVKAQMKITVK